MDHGDAVQQMIAERYLLNELTDEERDAFEEHLFECPECALDLRAGVAFVDEAKAQLPTLGRRTLPSPIPFPARQPQPSRDRASVWAWLRPAFAAPAFAALLLVIGYQNLVTYPALRAAASQPRLLAWAPLRGATRGAERMTVLADRRQGVALPIDLPPQPSTGTYASYAFELYFADASAPQGKLIWSGLAQAPTEDASSQRLSLALPGSILQNGSYSISVSGVAAHGARTPIDRYLFDLHFTD